VGDGI